MQLLYRVEGNAQWLARASYRIEKESYLLYYSNMSIADLIAEVDRLSPAEQERLSAHLKIRKQMQDAEFRKEMTRKIEDNDPANWSTLEEAEKRLFPEG